jgi:hypothetical protein
VIEQAAAAEAEHMIRVSGVVRKLQVGCFKQAYGLNGLRMVDYCFMKLTCMLMGGATTPGSSCTAATIAATTLLWRFELVQPALKRSATNV